MAYNLIERQIIYTGRRVRLEVHHLEGEDGRRTLREVCIHPGSVVVLPFLDQNTIMLVRNRRYSVGQILLELPAGAMEKGESPMNCAGRELQEETGYLSHRMKAIGSFFTSPGILSEKMYAFAAYDLEQTAPALEAGEEIEVERASLEQAIQMIGNGGIQDAKTIACLLMFERFGTGK